MAEAKTVDHKKENNGISDSEIEKNKKKGQDLKALNEENKNTISIKFTEGSLQNMVNPDLFSTPELGDFYLGAVDDTFLRMIEDKLKMKLDEINGKRGAEIAADRLIKGEAAAFYSGAAPYEDNEMGKVDGNNAYYLKASVSFDDEDMEMGFVDGRTLNININNLSGNDEAIKELKDSLLTTLANTNDDIGISDKMASEGITFTLRLVGLNSPASCKWGYIYGASKDRFTFITLKGTEAASRSDVYHTDAASKNDDELTFVKLGTMYRQVKNYIENTSNKVSFKVLIDKGNESAESSDEVTKVLRKVIELGGNEIYIHMDGKNIDMNSEVSASSVSMSDITTLGNIPQDTPGGCAYKTFFARATQEMDRRFQGEAFVKIDGVYVNIAKAVMMYAPKDKVSSANAYDGNNKDAYDIDKYDINNYFWADMFYDVKEKLDDRKDIQKKLFGLDYGELTKWTVAIGDVMLFVPPTNINVIESVNNETMPILRAKGTMTKGGHRVTRKLAMSVYFNEERGINGVAYEVEVGKDKKNPTKITYYMNGLRQLIAQFKFTPFLPIENEYINETLGIYAILFDTIQISHVPNYPHLYKAEIIMSEFDYETYMPEIAVMAEEKGLEDYGNPFSASINWAVMRYYYQRCIMRGEDIALSGYHFNSDEYRQLIIGNRTSLVPMAFKSNKMKLYIGDREQMDKMLEARMKQLSGKNEEKVAELTDAELAQMDKFKSLNNEIQRVIVSPECQDAINEISTNDDGSHYMEFKGNLFTDGGTVNNKKGAIEDKVQALSEIFNSDLKDAVNSNCADGDLVADISVSELKYEKVSDGYDVSFDVEFLVGTDYLSGEENLKDIKKDAGICMKMNPSKFYNDNKICVTYSAHFKDGTSTDNDENLDSYTRAQNQSKKKNCVCDKPFAIVADSPDMKFLDFCSNGKKHKEQQEKKKNDLRSIADLDNLKYVEYALGDYWIKDFNAMLSNHVSSVCINNISGTAAQYLGGEDTKFSLYIETTDQETVRALVELPKMVARMARDYHIILPYYPLRIESELTAFMGINEVVIENCSASTEADATGVYNIQMELRSVDRTLRDREAMERTAINNGGLLDGSEGTKTNKKVASYSDIKKLLSKAELYPDLELPTVKELEEAGFDYVRYKFQFDRTYVDPDFYFVYPQVLLSQCVRELCLNGMANGMGDSVLTDKAGASINITPTPGQGFTITEQNEKYKEQIEKIKAEHEKINAQDQKNTHDNAKKKAFKKNNNLILHGNIEQWSICDDITPQFLEQDYKDQLISYETNENQQTANQEGKWVSDAREKVVKASEDMIEYLKTHELHASPCEKGGVPNFELSPSEVPIKIETAVSNFLNRDEIKTFLQEAYVDYESETKLRLIIKDIVYASACAATGEKEFCKENSDDYKPNLDFFGMKNDTVGQDFAGQDLCSGVEEGVEEAIKFSTFGLKMYTREQLQTITNETIEEAKKKEGSINERYYLLDPYYRSDIERIIEYKRSAISSIEYSTEAFMRLMMYWLAKMIQMKLLPTMVNDIMRTAVINEQQIQLAEAERGLIDEQGNSEQVLSENIDFFKKRTYAIDAGKIYTAALFTLTDCDSNILAKISTSDYNALNAFTQSFTAPTTVVDAGDTNLLMARKMTLALGSKACHSRLSVDSIGTHYSTPAAKCFQNMSEKKYIAAAEDPNTFIPHSCHDMIVHDGRGRMIRAFPTFYMVFIDEGREIGMWRLHDNFYTTSALLSLQVVKNRKNPADTALITMSNFYQSYTTEYDAATRDYVDSDYMENSVSWYDAFESIYSPTEYGKKVEANRPKTPDVVRMRIREGARIHIRMGYGSSANNLPVVFNGSIAEVSAQDTIEIVAQGDGVELTNPILDDENAHTIASQEVRRKTDDFFSSIREGGYANAVNNTATPREIVTAVLNRVGGWVQRLAKDSGYKNLIDTNPYGIYHFGDKDFRLIHKSGEIVQNIFETYDTALWGDYTLDAKEANKINIEVFNKTPWEIVNICRSVRPDFVCGVVPFNFRSTVFMGHPRYYYAYDYSEFEGGSFVEKRKPFEQYHIYTSETDIIANGMKASSRDMKTNAIGMFEIDGGCDTIKVSRKTSPMMADIDIFPENQKTMVVDTKYYGKGGFAVGGFANNISSRWEATDMMFGDLKGSCISHFMMAQEMTVSALIDSMKDMYCGDLVVLGDPSVKPLDRIFISDLYEGFSGQAGVKEVTHSFSVDEGFVTTVTPDCIVKKVNDKWEPITNSFFQRTGSVTGAFSLYAAFVGIMKGHKKLMEREAVQKLVKKFFNCPLGKLFDKMGTDEVLEALAKQVGKLEGKDSGFVKGAASKAKKAIEALKSTGTVGKRGVQITKAVSNIIGRLALSGAGGAAVTGIGGALSTFLLPVVAGIAVSYAVTSMISAWIENSLYRVNCVSVFPIERYNSPYTAGLAGSRGLICSEHAPTRRDGIKSSLAKLLEGKVMDEDGSMLSKGVNGVVSAGFNFVNFLFLSDECNEQIEAFKQKNGIIDENGDPTMDNDFFAKKYVNSMSQVICNGDYRSMNSQPRVDLGTLYSARDEEMSDEDKKKISELKSKFKAAYDRFAIRSSDRWTVNPKLKRLSFVSDDQRLKTHIKQGFFRILHENPNMNNPEGENNAIQVRTHLLTNNAGQDKFVKTIVDKEDGYEIIDIAMLSDDALNILYELIRRSGNRLPAAQSTDPNENYEKNKTNYIFLKSALRIGDKKTLACTGYTFILSGGSEEAYDALIKSAEELKLEIKQDNLQYQGVNRSDLFSYLYGAENGIKDNEVLFTVYPPECGMGSGKFNPEGDSEKDSTEEEKKQKKPQTRNTDYYVAGSELTGDANKGHTEQERYGEDKYEKTTQKNTSNYNRKEAPFPANIPVEGYVKNVHDGDTLYFTSKDGVSASVRFYAADTPEASNNVGFQPDANLSIERLQEFMKGKKITTVFTGEMDNKGRRATGEVFADGESLTDLMIKEGLCTWYERYDTSDKAEQRRQWQEEAKAKRLGIWANDNYVNPEEFRHRHDSEQELHGSNFVYGKLKDSTQAAAREEAYNYINEFINYDSNKEKYRNGFTIINEGVEDDYNYFIEIVPK